MFHVVIISSLITFSLYLVKYMVYIVIIYLKFLVTQKTQYYRIFDWPKGLIIPQIDVNGYLKKLIRMIY